MSIKKISKANFTLPTASIVLLMFAFSCGKNPTDPVAATAPIQIERIAATPTHMGYGTVVALRANLSGGDAEALTLTWQCTGGAFTAGALANSGKSAKTTTPDISWKAPDSKGIYTISVTVSEANTSDSASVALNVLGLYFEDFSAYPVSWLTQNCAVSSSGGAAVLDIPASSWTRYCWPLNTPVPPPYALEMNIAFTTGFNLGSEAIGCYIHNMDTGSPDAKAFGFWLFPSASSFNFAMAIRSRVDANDDWYWAEDGGLNPVIPNAASTWIKIRMVVDADKNIIISVNDHWVYTYHTVAILEAFVNRSVDMRLKEVGSMASLSSSGSYKIDYVLVDQLEGNISLPHEPLL